MSHINLEATFEECSHALRAYRLLTPLGPAQTFPLILSPDPQIRKCTARHLPIGAGELSEALDHLAREHVQQPSERTAQNQFLNLLGVMRGIVNRPWTADGPPPKREALKTLSVHDRFQITKRG